MTNKQSVRNLSIQFLITAIVFFLAKFGTQFAYENSEIFSDSSTPISLLFVALSIACRIYVVVLFFLILPRINKWLQLLILAIIYSGATILSTPLDVSNPGNTSIYPLFTQLICYIYLALWIIKLFKKPVLTEQSAVSNTSTAIPALTENAVVNTVSSIGAIFAIVVVAGIGLILLVFLMIGMGSN